jgi:hypothetical protein
MLMSKRFRCEEASSCGLRFLTEATMFGQVNSTALDAEFLDLGAQDNKMYNSLARPYFEKFPFFLKKSKIYSIYKLHII